MAQSYESELIVTRAETAAVLNGVADGILAGCVRLGDGADAVTIDAPEEIAVEIELETEGDEVSLELEMEWSSPEDAGAEDTESARSPTEATADEGDSPIDDTPDDELDDTPDDELASRVGAADGSRSLAQFEVFRDRADEWRWRLRHRNGNIIATSGEGYTRKHNAWKGLRSVVQNAPEAEITEDFTG
jgi:amphi-Trp domain-containing protein